MYRPSEIAEAAEEADGRARQLRHVKELRGELPLNFPSSHFTWAEIERRAGHLRRRLDVLPWGADDLVHRDVHILPLTSAPTFLGRLNSFAEEVRDLAQGGRTVVAVTSHSRRLAEIFSEHGVSADVAGTLDAVPSPGSVTALRAHGAGLRDGFVLTVEGRRLAVFSDAEIFGVTKQRRVTRRTSAARAATPSWKRCPPATTWCTWSTASAGSPGPDARPPTAAAPSTWSFCTPRATSCTFPWTTWTA